MNTLITSKHFLPRCLKAFRVIPSYKAQNNSSVLSTAPELAQQLKRFALNPQRTGADIMNSIDHLAPRSQEHLVRVYRSVSHREMYDTLSVISNELDMGLYKGKVGIASCTLIGPRGIGKTTTLKNFVHVAPVIFPNIIPIYINYVNVVDNEYLWKRSILEIIADELFRHDIRVDCYEGDVFYQLNAALRKADKSVLLIVDEMDKLYEVQPEQFKWFTTLTSSLSQLALLGDDNSGRFAAILCGSSSRVSLLVTANGKKDPECVKDFPLVQMAPNLNGNKFRTRRIFATTPTELNTVSNILYDGASVTKDNIRAVRAVAFITGGVAREIQRLHRLAKDSAFFESFHVESNIQASNTLSTPAGALWRLSLELLYKKNESLMKELKNRDGTINVDKVMNVDWEERFQPLKFAEIRAAWQETEVQVGSLEHWLYHLFDRDYISIDGIRNGRPAEIYPYSMYMLARYPMSEKTKSITATLLRDGYKQLLGIGGEAVKSGIFQGFSTVSSEGIVTAVGQ